MQRNSIPYKDKLLNTSCKLIVTKYFKIMLNNIYIVNTFSPLLAKLVQISCKCQQISNYHMSGDITVHVEFLIASRKLKYSWLSNFGGKSLFEKSSCDHVGIIPSQWVYSSYHSFQFKSQKSWQVDVHENDLSLFERRTPKYCSMKKHSKVDQHPRIGVPSGTWDLEISLATLSITLTTAFRLCLCLAVGHPSVLFAVSSPEGVFAVPSFLCSHVWL